MADHMKWKTLSTLKLGKLSDHVDDWSTTNKEIKSHVEDFEGIVSYLETDAFGGCDDNAHFSPGSTAAVEQGKGLKKRLSAAKKEAEALKTTLDWAHDEFKRIRSKFNEKVDEINGTGSGTESNPGGNFSVDLESETVVRPSVPPGTKHRFEIQEWNDHYQKEAEDFAAELDDLAVEAAEVDGDVANWLYNNSAEKDDFNSKASKDMPSVTDAGEDAEEAADLLEGGEDGIVSEEELDKANDLMEEHKGDPTFSTTLMEDLGAKGLLTTTGEIAFTPDEDGNPRDKEDIEKMYENLGNMLATATDPDNVPHVDDKWIDELMEQGRQPIAISDPTTKAGNDGWTQYGYQALAPMLPHGKYDEEFIVPVTEHMITLDEQGAGWHTTDVPPYADGTFTNPVNGGLKALDNNPEAATAMFSEENGVSREKYAGLDGEKVDKPDTLEYLLDNSVDTNEGSYTGIETNLTGDAIEAACTGLSSDTELASAADRPKHTEGMVEVTKDFMKYATDHPEQFQGKDATLYPVVDNMTDVTVSYAEDFFKAYLNEEVATDPWVPNSHGVPLGLDPFSDGVHKTSMSDTWLQILGHDEEAAGTVSGAISAVTDYALAAGATDPDVATRQNNMSDAMNALGRVTGEVAEGTLHGLREDSIAKSTENAEYYAREGAKYLAGKGLGLVPLIGAELGTLSGYGIDALFGMNDEERQEIYEGKEEKAAEKITEGLKDEMLPKVEKALEETNIVDPNTADELIKQMFNGFFAVIEPPK